MFKMLSISLFLLAANSPASANTCAPDECSDATVMLQSGDIIARGSHSLLLMADYYGLPPVADGWVYMRVGKEVYRVDFQSHTVLDNVTDQTAANWF